MRARIKFTTEFNKDALVGILREHHWLPGFDQNSPEASKLIAEVQDSVDEEDVVLFRGIEKIVLSNTQTESKGTLSLEHEVWVVRLLNPSINLLQLACQTLVTHIVENALRNHKKIDFKGPIQIVERKRKETIIQGRVLATPQDRHAFARSNRRIEYRIAQIGFVTLLVLLLVTYPWSWHDPKNPVQTWILSVCEKFIGSVAVTTLISYFQYWTFLVSQREHAIQWSIPGEPEQLTIRAPSV